MTNQPPISDTQSEFSNDVEIIRRHFDDASSLGGDSQYGGGLLHARVMKHH